MMATICFIIGIVISASLKMRAVQLKKLLQMLDEMSILIQYKAMRTKELIAEIGKHDGFKDLIFLEILNESLELEEDINIGWKSAVKRTFFLSNDDKDILLNVGEQIGNTDVNGQLSMLELNKSMIERNLAQAEMDYKIKGKMFRTVWGMCGLAAGIIML